jgi:hypothetical protein
VSLSGQGIAGMQSPRHGQMIQRRTKASDQTDRDQPDSSAHGALLLPKTVLNLSMDVPLHATNQSNGMSKNGED